MQHWVASLGPPVLFLLVLLQQAGVPYPITPVLIVAGAVSVHGHLPAAAVIGLAVAAALIADLGWYTAGYRLGARALKLLCVLSLSPDSCVSDTERWFGRFGTRALVIAKFVPGLGLVATAMAGVSRASLEGFLFYDLIGSFLWASVAVGAGVLFHDAVGQVLQVLAELGYWGVALLVVALAAFIAVKLWQRYALIRELRLSRISVSELKEMVDRGPPAPVIIDALAPASRQREGVIPGAIPVETLRLDSGACNSPLRRGGDRLLRVPKRGLRGANRATVDPYGLHPRPAPNGRDLRLEGRGFPCRAAAEVDPEEGRLAAGRERV